MHASCDVGPLVIVPSVLHHHGGQVHLDGHRAWPLVRNALPRGVVLAALNDVNYRAGKMMVYRLTKKLLGPYSEPPCSR